MNTRYLYALLCAFLFVNCAHSNKIELSEIETRLQLDSVMALLSKDSVRIDSLPQRELRITLDGNFTLYGVQTDQVSYTLINEELSSLNVMGYTGFETLLTNIENANGLGLYENRTFTWDILDRQMELRNYYNSPGSLLEMSDENDYDFRYVYYPHSKNAITDLVTDTEVVKSDYYLSFSVHYGASLEAELWLNGFKIADDKSINEFLVPGGNMELKIKMSDDGCRLVKALKENGVAVTINLLRQGKVMEQVEAFELLPEKEQTFSFNVDVPQIYPKLTVDLRKIPEVKDRLYQYYEKLYNAFRAKDEAVATEMMLPYFRARALAYNYDKKKIHLAWREFNHLVTNAQRVRLIDKSKLDVLFTEDGTVATLVTKEEGVLSVRSKEYNTGYYTFYFYEDENGDIKIYF